MVPKVTILKGVVFNQKGKNKWGIINKTIIYRSTKISNKKLHRSFNKTLKENLMVQ